jgi:hypothetical protein
MEFAVYSLQWAVSTANCQGECSGKAKRDEMTLEFFLLL